MRQPLHDFLIKHQIKGTLIIAPEGINGTVAATQSSIMALREYLGVIGFTSLNYKESFTNKQPFLRTKVRLKKEIVTLRQENANPGCACGIHVEPKDWNALISDPNVVTIDTRNDYEVEIGTFKNAINPKTENFVDFPEFVKNKLQDKKNKKIAMFCTGGIRCEKSTSYLLQMGFKDVYHLKGGILNYLEKIPQEQSLWQGECFVFDERVSVNHDLEKGTYDICHGCKFPLSEADKQHKDYQVAVKCHRCAQKFSPKHYQKAAIRHKQMQIAKQKGILHLGNQRDIQKNKRNAAH